MSFNGTICKTNVLETLRPKVGRVDEVRILDRTLTAEEITAIYANSSVKYRNSFTYKNNTNLMFTLGYSIEQNTTSFSPSVNTLGFSGEVLECYSNDTEVLVREEVTKEEFIQAIKEAIKNENSAIKGEKSENFLEKIIKEIQKFVQERE